VPHCAEMWDMKVYPYAKANEDPIFAAVGEKEASFLHGISNYLASNNMGVGSNLSDNP
jgi:hypothetical protein